MGCPSDGEKACIQGFAYKEERVLCFHTVLQGGPHRLLPSLHRQLQVV